MIYIGGGGSGTHFEVIGNHMSVVASRTRNQHAPVVIPLFRYVVCTAFAAGPTGKCQVVARLHFAACRGGDGAGDGADGGGLLSFLWWLDNVP